jgi:hypothetical protein
LRREIRWYRGLVPAKENRKCPVVEEDIKGEQIKEV